MIGPTRNLPVSRQYMQLFENVGVNCLSIRFYWQTRFHSFVQQPTMFSWKTRFRSYVQQPTMFSQSKNWGTVFNYYFQLLIDLLLFAWNTVAVSFYMITERFEAFKCHPFLRKLSNSVCRSHNLPSHSSPFPVNPSSQAQVWDPLVLL